MPTISLSPFGVLILALAARRGPDRRPFNVAARDRVARLFDVKILWPRALDVAPVERVPEELWLRRDRATETRQRVCWRQGVGAARGGGQKVAVCWAVAGNVLGGQVHDGPVPCEDVELGL